MDALISTQVGGSQNICFFLKMWCFSKRCVFFKVLCFFQKSRIGTDDNSDLWYGAGSLVVADIGVLSNSSIHANS